jgi:nicotinamide-nucleotide amidase
MGARLLERGEWLVTAESCTGGGGRRRSRDCRQFRWFDRGFVTYSIAPKRDMLGCRKRRWPPWCVSEATARAMAAVALAHSAGDWPWRYRYCGTGGGTPDKPSYGLLCVALAGGGIEAQTCHFPGDGRRSGVVGSACTAGLLARWTMRMAWPDGGRRFSDTRRNDAGAVKRVAGFHAFC